MNYIDLFAGAGGLSEGFIRENFNPIAHIEKDHYACQTIKTRLAYHYLKKEKKLDSYEEYLRGELSQEKLYSIIPKELLDTVINLEISEDLLQEIFQKIDKNLGDDKIDLIVGGPPCQAYSKASAHIKEKDKKLVYLYELYGRFLDEYKPKMFVFENVPGLYNADSGKYFDGLISYFENVGYKISDKVLNASNFNVPQNRKRVILIGWDKKYDLTYPEFELKKADTTINDLFRDLPLLNNGDSIEIGSYESHPSYYVSNYIRNGINVLTQHIARPHNEKDLRIYEMAIKLWGNKNKRLKNSEIPKNIRTQNNTSSFLDRFKVVDGEGLSHTMIAHIAKDGHYYIHPDINQLRSLSVREAARIQSFPDDYFFEGSRTSVFTQIGNAVPPLMAQTIAKGIKEKLNGIN